MAARPGEPRSRGRGADAFRVRRLRHLIQGDSCGGRSAVRHTWMKGAQRHGALARFILTEEERSPAIEAVRVRHDCLPRSPA